jgi:hypothetical protein
MRKRNCCSWSVIENQYLMTRMKSTTDPSPHPGFAFSAAGWKLNMISRYEATIERSLHRALMTLERRQARRRNEPVPAPIAVQVEGSDDAGDASIAVIEAFPAPLVSSDRDHAMPIIDLPPAVD